MFPFFSYIPTFFFLLLLLQPFSFPARTVPSDPLTALTVNGLVNQTWHNFAKFVDVEIGTQVSGMSELKKYFHRFGYLPKKNDTFRFDDEFDSDFETAVNMYQKKLGLPITGKLDLETISVIMKPRCGMIDTVGHSAFHTTRHYAYFYGKPRWTSDAPLNLSYGFSPDHTVDYLSSSDVKAVFRRAFSRWESVIPVNFSETEDYKSAEIKIGFYSGDHGDGEPFDGVLGVLAHAFSPENGRLHLDAEESWSINFKADKSNVAVDLESVATHEIGHVLGLAHSSIKEAVMYPSLSPRTKKVDLRLDDVEGVQALYGTNPNFKIDSLLESDSYSSGGIGLESFRKKWTTNLVIMFGLILGWRITWLERLCLIFRTPH